MCKNNRYLRGAIRPRWSELPPTHIARESPRRAVGASCICIYDPLSHSRLLAEGHYGTFEVPGAHREKLPEAMIKLLSARNVDNWFWYYAKYFDTRESIWVQHVRTHVRMLQREKESHWLHSNFTRSCNVAACTCRCIWFTSRQCRNVMI